MSNDPKPRPTRRWSTVRERVLERAEPCRLQLDDCKGEATGDGEPPDLNGNVEPAELAAAPKAPAQLFECDDVASVEIAADWSRADPERDPLAWERAPGMDPVADHPDPVVVLEHSDDANAIRNRAIQQLADASSELSGLRPKPKRPA